MNTQGTICGVCGRYTEYPTIWSGTLPEKCNGNHMPYPCNPNTQFALRDNHDLMLEKLDKIIELLTPQHRAKCYNNKRI